MVTFRASSPSSLVSRTLMRMAGDTDLVIEALSNAGPSIRDVMLYIVEHRDEWHLRKNTSDDLVTKKCPNGCMAIRVPFWEQVSCVLCRQPLKKMPVRRSP